LEPKEEERVYEILDRIRAAVKERRLLPYTFFSDYEKVRKQKHDRPVAYNKKETKINVVLRPRLETMPETLRPVILASKLSLDALEKKLTD
jgi:hypothetical protein